MTEDIVEFAVIRELWQQAEQLGYSAIWNQDNVYPHVADRGAPIFDCWTTLSALATCTSRIRFGPMVAPAPRRHPALLAKAASTLDVISGGRLTIGIGAGDPSTVGMYTQWGMRFPEKKDRIPLLEEHLQVQRRLYDADPANFDGHFFQLHDAVCAPKPVQQSGPPIWIGLNKRAKAMARVAADHADGIVIEWGDDQVAAQVEPALRAACVEVERDPGELTKARLCLALVTDGSCTKEEALREMALASGRYDPQDFPDAASTWLGVLFGTPDEISEQIEERVLALGFDHLMCQFYGVGLGDDNGGLAGFQGNVLAAMRAFAGEVMPAFSHERSR